MTKPKNFFLLKSSRETSFKTKLLSLLCGVFLTDKLKQILLKKFEINSFMCKLWESLLRVQLALWCKSLSVLAAMKLFVSSAYKTLSSRRYDGRSFMNTMKKKGPNSYPCGTPVLTGFLSECLL